MKSKFTKLMAAFTLLVFMAPSMVGWGQERSTATIQYSGSTTTNMTGNNDAALVGLTATDWSVVGAKGGNSNFPGLNKDGDIRLYYHANGSNTITVTNLNNETISSITITYKSNYSNGKVLVNGSEVTGSNGTYVINATSFVVTNGNTSNTQVRFEKIEMTYGTGGGSNLITTAVSIDATGITNTDVYTSTTAGTLTASVTYDDNGTPTNVLGATVTWASTDPTVATVDQTGAVTLVAVGTTNITATYAGDNTYATSSDTYQLTVTSSAPAADVTFIAGTDHGSNGDYNNPDQMTKDGVTISGTNAAFNQNPYRIYANSTTTISAPGHYITSIVFNIASGYNASNLSTTTGTYSNGTWTGSASTIEFSASAQVRVSSIEIWMTANNTPAISASPSTLNTFSYLNTSTAPSAAQQVSVSGANLSADIIVSVDANSAFEMCTTENGTYSDNDITLQHASGVVSATNIYVRMKANQTGNPTGTLTLSSTGATSVTIALNGSVVTPMTVAAALAATAPQNGVYVHGYISQIDEVEINQYHNATYWISDDGTTTGQMKVYHGKYLNNEPFTATDQIGVGDEVVVTGNITEYQNANQLASGNYIVSLTPHQAQQFTLAVTSVSNAEIIVFDATDPDDTNWVSLFVDVDEAQVTEGTPIALSVSADQGYGISSLMVDGDEHVADIDGGLYTFNMPAHDVNITVTAMPVYTIMFFVNGQEWAAAEMEIPQGQALGTLPVPAANIPTGFTFVGWMESPANAYYNATTPPTMVDANIVPADDMILEAVFCISESNPGTWQLSTTAPEAGDQVVLAVNDEGTYYAFYGAGNSQQLTVANNVVTTANPEDYAWNLVEATYNSQSGLGLTNGDGKLHMNSSNFKIASDFNNGIFDFTNNQLYGVVNNRYLTFDATNHSFGVSDNAENACTLVYFKYIAGSSSNYDYTTLVVNHANNTYIAQTSDETLYGIHYINGSVNANWVVTNNGKLVIKSDGALDLTGHTLTNLVAANLIIEDGAQVICDNAFEGTMLKDITAYPDVNGNAGYYLIASPLEDFEPTAANGFLTQNYDLYAYDATEDDEWINFKVDGGFNLFGYQGYLYASGQNTTLRFEGLLNDQTSLNEGKGGQEILLNYEGGDDLMKDLTLVGNSGTAETTFMMYDGNIELVVFNYLTLNEDGNGFNTGNDEYVDVASLNAVFVQAPEAGCYMSNADGYAGKSVQNVNVKVSRVNGNLLDNAIMSYNGSMMRKIYLNDYSTRVYFPISNEDYAVVPAQMEGEQPVNFKANENGTYVLSVEVNNLEMNYLHLIDNMTGADVDLLATPSYTFEAKTTDYASRFRLVFSAEENGASTGSATFAFFNGSEWVVSNTGEATLQVVDVLGRVLSTETVNGNATINVNQPTGVYMLRLVNGNNVRVQKVVVR